MLRAQGLGFRVECSIGFKRVEVSMSELGGGGGLSKTELCYGLSGFSTRQVQGDQWQQLVLRVLLKLGRIKLSFPSPSCEHCVFVNVGGGGGGPAPPQPPARALCLQMGKLRKLASKQ